MRRIQVEGGLDLTREMGALFHKLIAETALETAMAYFVIRWQKGVKGRETIIAWGEDPAVLEKVDCITASTMYLVYTWRMASWQ